MSGPGGTASAAVAGLQRVAGSTDFDSSNESATASCPADKNLLGVGADVNAGKGQVMIDALSPFSGLTGVRVTGMEDESGNAAPWSLAADAIWASP
jgi:hypothetical protein